MARLLYQCVMVGTTITFKQSFIHAINLNSSKQWNKLIIKRYLCVTHIAVDKAIIQARCVENAYKLMLDTYMFERY